MSLKFRPEQMDPLTFYGYMVGSVVPRPIAFASTVNKAGRRNLAPFSFFNIVSVDPPVVGFSVLIRGDGEKKDTLRNIEETGEFVLNIVSEPMVEGLNKAAAEVDADIDEFVLSGLTPIPSDLVTPPRVKEAKVHFECRLRDIIRFGDALFAGNLILGDILMIDVDESVITETNGLKLIDPMKLRSFGRMAGISYARATDLFDLERPPSRPPIKR